MPTNIYFLTSQKSSDSIELDIYFKLFHLLMHYFSDKMSINSHSELVKPKDRKKTIYLCFFKKCGFSTTKEGFYDKTVANHLFKFHKITIHDIVNMRPEQRRFIKIKWTKGVKNALNSKETKILHLTLWCETIHNANLWIIFLSHWLSSWQ